MHKILKSLTSIFFGAAAACEQLEKDKALHRAVSNRDVLKVIDALANGADMTRNPFWPKQSILHYACKGCGFDYPTAVLDVLLSSGGGHLLWQKDENGYTPIDGVVHPGVKSFLQSRKNHFSLIHPELFFREFREVISRFEFYDKMMSKQVFGSNKIPFLHQAILQKRVDFITMFAHYIKYSGLENVHRASRAHRDAVYKFRRVDGALKKSDTNNTLGRNVPQELLLRILSFLPYFNKHYIEMFLNNQSDARLLKAMTVLQVAAHCSEQMHPSDKERRDILNILRDLPNHFTV